MALQTRAAAALALALAVAPMAKADWQTHRYETDGFTVEFSGPVTVKPLDVNSDTQAQLVRTTSYLQDGGSKYAYLVGASLFKPDADFDFDAGVKGTMDSYKCKVTGSDLAKGAGANRTREIHASDCAGSGIRVGARFFLVGKWFYQVVYLISKDSKVADAERFLGSFTLSSK